MDEKETICQIRLFTSGLCEVEFSVEIGCCEVAVTKCPAPYKVIIALSPTRRGVVSGRRGLLANH